MADDDDFVELKPCLHVPVFTGDAIEELRHFVLCDEANEATPEGMLARWYLDRIEAITAWNTRPDRPEQVSDDRVIDCENCGWIGPAGKLDDIQRDASPPAGKCPTCGVVSLLEYERATPNTRTDRDARIAELEAKLADAVKYLIWYDSSGPHRHPTAGSFIAAAKAALTSRGAHHE